MQYPAEGLGEIVRWANDSRNMMHSKILLRFPFLNGKMLDINVTGSFSRDTIINHDDSRNIVTIYRSGLIDCIPQFLQDCRRHLACLAARTAARNSASVLNVAMIE